MTILDNYVVKICPSDLIGCNNIGTKVVRLSQKVLGEPVSDYYPLHFIVMYFYKKM